MATSSSTRAVRGRAARWRAEARCHARRDVLHSLISDWNHGNAHFLRGVAARAARARPRRARVRAGRRVERREPRRASTARHRSPDSRRPTRSWCPPSTCTGLVISIWTACSTAPISSWCTSGTIRPWSRAIGERAAARRPFVLLFHDTHHRSVTDPHEMAAYDLADYDGVLAFGDVIRDVYVANGWAAARVDVARSRRHAALRAASGREARGRPRLDRQLG